MDKFSKERHVVDSKFRNMGRDNLAHEYSPKFIKNAVFGKSPKLEKKWKKQSSKLENRYTKLKKKSSNLRQKFEKVQNQKKLQFLRKLEHS